MPLLPHAPLLHRLLSHAWLLLCLLLAACGGGGAGGAAADTGPSLASSNAVEACSANAFQAVLTAAAIQPTGSGGGVTAGVVRLHYHRADGDYAGWQLYVWNAPSEALGAWPGRNLSGTDSYGIYWDVPVSAAAFNFIIHNGDSNREPSNWSGANGDQQQFWSVASGSEVFKLAGDATNYVANPLSGAVPDITSVRVHYKRFDSAYSAWGLHLWATSGLDVAGLTGGTTIEDYANPVSFDQMPGYAPGSGEVVFDIPVLNPKADASRTALEFIIHGKSPNQDDKDGRPNNIRVSYAGMKIVAQRGEIWLVQQDAAVYTSAPDTRLASTTDARAYWLSRHLIQWPRVDASGVFKLYHSARGSIVAVKNDLVTGADGALTLDLASTAVPTDLAARFAFVAPGVVVQVSNGDLASLPGLLARQLVLVQEDATGHVQNASTAQLPGVLDDLYASAAAVDDLGVNVISAPTPATGFKLWAPTAQKVSLCLYDSGSGTASSADALSLNAATGVWQLSKPADLGGKYYKYMVEVFVRGVGVVRNLVTDPYSVSLTTDSRRSWIGSLAGNSVKPAGWDTHAVPAKVAAQTDMVVYELHVRDFSANDASVSASNRGKYLAFTEGTSNGMKHLKALATAGLTDVHLMPVFDIASVPEAGCVSPTVSGVPDGEQQQATIGAVQDNDCFNWGYDPWHFNAPEGSYASDAADGAVRVLEFRRMVAALHGAGLRVGMDVVYNHTTASGQNAKSVLDRVVPGYYHRLNATGGVENSSCCDNTATENLMMGKLMSDSVLGWARDYRIDSFRFDLMAHQPRAVMTAMQARVQAALGRPVQFIGEGWNFGEVANGARFVQASQLSLNGSGIATFSDRARDYVRGGGPFDSGNSLLGNQGYINGLFYDGNANAAGKTRADLLAAADFMRVGLAGSIRDYSFTNRFGVVQQLQQVDYNGQPAGYVSSPDEVVNYIENHDNQTLFDINAYKLPTTTSREDRARVQMLGVAINAFSQGVAYFHAGVDTLRSKSMDRNSYNSGDWFNRLDWSYADNNFGVGAPPAGDNASNWSVIKPLLANTAIKPVASDIALARDLFRDLLEIRASSSLFRLRTAADVKARLSFVNTGTAQVATVVGGHLDGAGYAGAGFSELIYFVNVDKVTQTLTLPAEAGKAWVLHPVHGRSVDRRVANGAAYATASGAFTLPPRSAVVFVMP